VQIRKYLKQHDEAVIINLLKLNTPQYFAEEEEKDLIFFLENHAQNFFVLEVDNEILGCGGFNFTNDLSTGKLSWDIIHPQHQGRGYGTKLTQFRIEQLKTYPTVKTISVRTSQLVYPVYEKFGFKTKEVVKDFWAVGFDLYRMEFDLNT
jgi:ribosomal protein S18 acetylase RimI-like enzyme